MVEWLNPKYQALESQFQQLDHKEKKQKVTNILAYLKDKLDFASDMWEFIAQAPDVSDEFLTNMYQTIMKSAVDIAQQESDEASQTMLYNIAQITAQHAKLDEQEHQDADNLLNLM